VVGQRTGAECRMQEWRRKSTRVVYLPTAEPPALNFASQDFCRASACLNVLDQTAEHEEGFSVMQDLIHLDVRHALESLSA